MACCACSGPRELRRLWATMAPTVDTVVQLFKDQLLQPVGRLAFPGVDAGLDKQTPGIDLGPSEERPQADILCRHKVLVRCRAVPGALLCTEIVFRHPQLYHHELAAAVLFDGSDPIKRRENCRRQAW